MSKYYKHKNYVDYIYSVDKLHYTTYDLTNKLASINHFDKYTVPFESLDTVCEITKSEFDSLLLWNLMSSHIENITMKSKIIAAF